MKMSESIVIGYCSTLFPPDPHRSARPQLLFSCCRALPRAAAFSFRGRISNSSSIRGRISISSSTRGRNSASCSSPLRSWRFDFAAFGRFLARRSGAARTSCLARGLESKSESGGTEGDIERDTGTESGGEGEKRSVESRLVEEKRRSKTRVGAETSAASTMLEILDLEKQFSFYGAYHNNKVNVFIHVLFVWPIFYTTLILWAYTAPLAALPLAAGTLPLQEYMVLNASFVQAGIYALYYIALDKKAGSLGALICLGCWIGANAVAQALPWSLSWKIVLASQVTCWFFQIFGHQKFEGRAPALLDNLPQAFLMAPFFVLLECLQGFGYEPYPGFQKKVQKNVDDAIREFKQSKAKKAA